MSDGKDMEQPLVFGLDIGTRNVVGTVGYRTEDQFIVTAQYIMQHDTRAMLDGQIHDIGRVSGTIRKVKEQLEKQIGKTLTEVCIAAAGRVLKDSDNQYQLRLSGGDRSYRGRHSYTGSAWN